MPGTLSQYMRRVRLQLSSGLVGGPLRYQVRYTVPKHAIPVKLFRYMRYQVGTLSQYNQYQKKYQVHCPNTCVDQAAAVIRAGLGHSAISCTLFQYMRYQYTVPIPVIPGRLSQYMWDQVHCPWGYKKQHPIRNKKTVQVLFVELDLILVKLRQLLCNLSFTHWTFR